MQAAKALIDAQAEFELIRVVIHDASLMDRYILSVVPVEQLFAQSSAESFTEVAAAMHKLQTRLQLMLVTG